MFTGIVETLGVVSEIKKENSNIHFKIDSPISSDLTIDQSVAHNGVCLTVTKVENNAHWLTAISETLQKSNLGDVEEGDSVNLERCLSLNDRLDGHIVQGHVDTSAQIKNIFDEDGSWKYVISLPDVWAPFIVKQGSICINGVSLTVAEINKNTFSVAIIPYTYENTTFKFLKKGDRVNLEFDIVGKYILRSETLKSE